MRGDRNGCEVRNSDPFKIIRLCVYIYSVEKEREREVVWLEWLPENATEAKEAPVYFMRGVINEIH